PDGTTDFLPGAFAAHLRAGRFTDPPDLICASPGRYRIYPWQACAPAQSSANLAFPTGTGGARSQRLRTPKEARRGSFDAWLFNLRRCGGDGNLPVAIGAGAGSSLSRLALPAIEGPGNFDRERLDRSRHRPERHQTSRCGDSRPRRAPRRAPYADRGRTETDRNLRDRNQGGKTGQGEDAVCRALFEAQRSARPGDGRHRAFLAQTKGDGRTDTRGNPEAARHAGQGKSRSGTGRRARQPVGVADAHFRGPAEIHILRLRRARADREAAV